MTDTTTADIANATLPDYDADELRAEVAAVDVADFAGDDTALRDVLKYQRRRGQLEAELTHVIEQHKAFVRSMEAKINSLDWLYRELAESFCRSRLTGKGKSIRTNFGVMGFRKTPESVVVLDEQKLIEAVGMAPVDSPLAKLTRTRVEVAKFEVNEYVKTTGDLPPGVEVREAVETFYVR